jgi:outer membrane murein-binding lipoprotein Lpp
MRITKTIALATFIMLAGCASQLSPEDRATLNDTRTMAMEARDEAAKAAQSAAQSAAAAQAASEKANRAFMQSQKK